MQRFVDRNFFFLLVVSVLLATAPASGQTAASNADSPSCVDNLQRFLLQEDSTIVVTKFITATRDGNFLVPGYYYPNRGVYYKMPYLIKCTPRGDILWSKGYPSQGNYPSNWFTATRIKEMNNGDLLMVGEIGVPGTDDRRELAVWRLDNTGTQLWAQSYESSLWRNPITGATEVTGIEEDVTGNVFLTGNLKFFESSRYAFVLKMDPKGTVVWDKNFATTNALAYGSALLQNKLLVIGSSGPLTILPGIESNILWCITINPVTGDTINTKAWYPDFNEESYIKSFAYANTTVGLLDNGAITVTGTANADFLAVVGQVKDTIRHSIVANFTPDFEFAGGIMLCSTHQTNYYNTVTTQHPNGRISYSRFLEGHNLYNEDIVYGNIENNLINGERVHREVNRSSTSVSNFIHYQPGEDIVIQSYSDSITKLGGLEIVRLVDGHVADDCSGKDTSITFLEPYLMRRTSLQLDSIVEKTMHFSYHNFVNESIGHLSKETACASANSNIHYNPLVSLNNDTVICRGSALQLTPGGGYSQYLWSNGSTDSSVTITDTGLYWVSVTDVNGCKGSDTVSIVARVDPPREFLPRDTFLCLDQTVTIMPAGNYRSYVWSDLSTATTLVVNRPGRYWLQVTDSNNCSGVDSIEVSHVTCSKELLVPNAFTPNGDGRNDIFRPRLYGTVTGFSLIIYNRWGQKVFECRSPTEGWDGKVNGTPAGDGIFVWYCSYQLAGQATKTQKGVVALIR